MPIETVVADAIRLKLYCKLAKLLHRLLPWAMNKFAPRVRAAAERISVMLAKPEDPGLDNVPRLAAELVGYIMRVDSLLHKFDATKVPTQRKSAYKE